MKQCCIAKINKSKFQQNSNIIHEMQSYLTRYKILLNSITNELMIKMIFFFSFNSIIIETISMPTRDLEVFPTHFNHFFFHLKKLLTSCVVDICSCFMRVPTINASCEKENIAYSSPILGVHAPSSQGIEIILGVQKKIQFI